MNNLPFGKKNYILMIAGVLAIAIGLIFMTMDDEAYGFGFMGITLGPIIIMIGFAIEFVAIFIKDESAE